MKSREFRTMFSLTLDTVSIETGYSKAGISKWERELETMPQGYVDKIKEVYGVTIEKQHKFYVTNEKYDKTVKEYEERIKTLKNEKFKLEQENAKLQYKLKQIMTLAGE